MIITGDNRYRLPILGPVARDIKAQEPAGQPAAKSELPADLASPPTESYVPSRRPLLGGPLKYQEMTPERKKALAAARMGAQVELTRKHAVIVGGGPGGLAAAITLSKLGMKVTVLEARANETGDKPAHARPHQISLRQDSLEMLKKLGAYDEVIGTAGFVQKEVHLHDDGQTQRISEKVPQARSQDHSDDKLLHPTLLHTDSVSQVRISDVEKALLKQAQSLGIDIRAGVKADLVKSANGTSFDVNVSNVVKDGNGGYTPVGEATSLGTPDLVVVADGAGSPTRAAIGIEVLEESKAKHYLGGHIQKGIGAETRKATLSEADGSKRHLMATGHAQYDQTWVSCEISAQEASLPVAERAKLLAEKSQFVMMQEVTSKDIGWGAGQVTTVQNRRAQTAAAGDNVVLLGDAAGTGSVWVGGGLNLALTTHLSALRSLGTRVNTGSDREAALNIYDKTIQWATTVWHNAGATELGVAPPAKTEGTLGLAKSA